MGQVVGSLRPDRATAGEKLVLKRLRDHLPNEFYIYPECPINQHRQQRFPDFIVLANFGVVVLEVKDWVEIIKADKYNAQIRRRDGTVHRMRNPVLDAREQATALSSELQKIPGLLKKSGKLDVPWGYAVLLPNLPPSVLSQLREAWGDDFVLGKGDLEAPVVTQRLRGTIPKQRPLRSEEMDYIRGVINPTVLIVPEESSKPAILLNQEQEAIVSEAPPRREKPKKGEPVPTSQQSLWDEIAANVGLSAADDALPPEGEDIAASAHVRLVRGVAGSGKTLVLTRRAQYLAAQYPEWKLCLMTYGSDLVESLQARVKGYDNIEQVKTFHGLCVSLLKPHIKWREPQNMEGYLRRWYADQPAMQAFGGEFVAAEITWLKEMGIRDRDTYLTVARKGRSRPLSTNQRALIFDVYAMYQQALQEKGLYDWQDLPGMVVELMDAGAIAENLYDAILIDEAQDFAPVWMAVVQRLLKSDGGSLFLADDPSQSIYRFYSWREKGVHVVGRTRWLRIPYRNTREIYQAAYEVIRTDETLKHQIEEQTGLTLAEPDLTNPSLRSGPRPQLRHFDSFDDEVDFIRAEIQLLQQAGIKAQEIAVLHRRKVGVRHLQRGLQGLKVYVDTLFAPKGLEFEAVFLSQMQDCFSGNGSGSEEQLSEERRLTYMAMTRARQRLYLGYVGRWPAALQGVQPYVD
jgi:hypothetical protein